MHKSAPLLVFSDDWGRHPSSCQHLIQRLVDHHEIYWVNTIGMRPPRFNLSTVLRGLEKARQWVRPFPRQTPDPLNPRVLNPRMWPWMSSRFSRAVNRKLLLRQLRPIVEAMTMPPIVVTTVPVVADLIGILPARRWVYYCVDDFGVWPGLDHASIREMEAVLVRKAHDVIAVSENLQNRLADMGRDAHLLTHGVDIDHWINGQHACPASVDGLARPLVVFWGVVDRRMDTDLIRQLSDSLSEGTIVLAGPLSSPDPALLRLPKVVTPGSIPYGQLPALAQEAAVLIMPYADTPVNRAIQPLKLKEYLATGRPVVVRDLPANREWRDCLDLVRGPAEFADTVCRRIRSGLSPHQLAARERLAGESWDVKAPLFEHWVIRQAPEIATAC